MSPWFAKAILLLATIVMILIRAPFWRRSLEVKVVKSRKGPREFLVRTVAGSAFLILLLWLATQVLDFADYPIRNGPLAGGILCLVVGLWLFHRSHSDLGTNWSITLELRETHRLVTQGVYRRIRHPMYLALLLYSLGQALVLPNWIAGPCCVLGMLLIFALRVGPEERLMSEAFPDTYEEYRIRTKRLVPGLW